MVHGEGVVVGCDGVDDGRSVGCEMGCGTVGWRVAVVRLTEARGSAGRHGARLVLPGEDTVMSGCIGFVGS